MITALQNLGDGNPFKFSRARVVWIVENPSRSMSSAWRSARTIRLLNQRNVMCSKTLEPGRVGMPQGSRQQPHNSVNNHGRPQLSSREHIDADRDLAIAQQLAHALVDALISSADQHNALDASHL